MFFLLALSLLSVATVGSVVAYQRASARALGGGKELAALPASTGPATERTLQTLRVGDVVLDGEDDWLIVGTVTYREEQDVWWIHRLEDGARIRLLEVRKRPDWTPAMLELADDAPTFGQLYNGLTFRSHPYQLERRGDARLKAEGDAHCEGGLIRYITYRGPSQQVLHIEETSAGRKGYAGRVLPSGTLTLMPGEGQPEQAA